MFEYICRFFIWAFLGWCAEVIYAAVKHGKFVNRGFLNGSICPIYGFGVVIILFCLTPLKGCMPLLFICSVILTSALELMTGFVLEKVFHQKWWDYSNTKFNIGGYICLRFSLLWGVACVVIVYFIQPLIDKLIGIIPRTLGLIIVSLLISAVIADLAVTVKNILNMNDRLKKLEEITANIRKLSDSLGEGLSDEVIALTKKSNELKEKREELKCNITSISDAKKQEIKEKIAELKGRHSEISEKSARSYKRIFNAFPTMRSTRYKETFENLRQRIKENKK